MKNSSQIVDEIIVTSDLGSQAQVTAAHITDHFYRKTWLILLLILMMGSSSCHTQRQPVRRINFPQREVVLPDPELEVVAQNLELKLHVPIDSRFDNLGLYSFVNDWKGTPYRFGRNAKSGTDCSGFVYRLYQDVYGINIGRTSSAALMNRSSRIKRSELQEGDMVFFNINNRRGGSASHVGVYLKDNKFVHASTRSGVIVSDLREPYYARTYIGAGRVL